MKVKETKMYFEIEASTSLKKDVEIEKDFLNKIAIKHDVKIDIKTFLNEAKTNVHICPTIAIKTGVLFPKNYENFVADFLMNYSSDTKIDTDCLQFRDVVKK